MSTSEEILDRNNVVTVRERVSSSDTVNVFYFLGTQGGGGLGFNDITRLQFNEHILDDS